MSDADDIRQYPTVAKGVDGDALLARMKAEGKQAVYVRFGEPSPTKNIEWNEIASATLYSRSRKLSENVSKNNVLFALLGYGHSTEELARRRARNQRRALKRWRAREARRNSAASAVVLSTPTLAAACGLPEPGAPADLMAAIREAAKSR